MSVTLEPELGTDSFNYEVLSAAVLNTVGVPGMTCEIGLRHGGGSKYMIDALIASDQKYKTHVAIDPYGNIEYRHDDWTNILKSDYTNAMRDDCLYNMYLYVLQKGVNFVFFNLEDSEFFARYADGVPLYTESKTICNEYSVVHLDGAHTLDKLYEEIAFFHPRMPVGAYFVCDDVGNYDHSVIDRFFLTGGYENVDKTERKWSYRKVEPKEMVWPT